MRDRAAFHQADKLSCQTGIIFLKPVSIQIAEIAPGHRGTVCGRGRCGCRCGGRRRRWGRGRRRPALDHHTDVQIAHGLTCIHSNIGRNTAPLRIRAPDIAVDGIIVADIGAGELMIGADIGANAVVSGLKTGKPVISGAIGQGCGNLGVAFHQGEILTGQTLIRTLQPVAVDVAEIEP